MPPRRPLNSKARQISTPYGSLTAELACLSETYPPNGTYPVPPVVRNVADTAYSTQPFPQPGIQPLLRVYDAHAEYTGVHRHKRPSAATIHLPIWHADMRSFVISRTNQAHRRLRNLYPSVWIPDILCVALAHLPLQF